MHWVCQLSRSSGGGDICPDSAWEAVAFKGRQVLVAVHPMAGQISFVVVKLGQQYREVPPTLG